MKTYAIISMTNYGETILLVNAENEDEARSIAEKDDRCWEGYSIEEIDTKASGVVFFGGGGY